ncbi:cell wall protein AWA1-like isoform X3 [Penaeus japonicus]|uniref:cell wall protein AWA1-like isoform X3 n=1 Tax=Penaeus japonicus TaxID=27405 RepID=UPI001C70BAE1|nr:cell wall protein AWA1-like isoform X3 [Penaeus japonicus]
MTTAGATSEPSTITIMTDLASSIATGTMATSEFSTFTIVTDQEQTGSSVSPDSATQGPGVGNTMAGEQTESTATDVSVTDGLDEEITTGEEQTGSPVTAAPVSLGPDADNTTGGAPATESPVTEVSEGQGPGADNTTRDGEQTGSPVTAAPVSLGPDADNTTGGAPVTESPVTEGPEGPGGDNTTRDGEIISTTLSAVSEQTGSPVTAGPVTLRPDGDNTTGGENTESPVTGAPVTQDPDTGDTTKAEIEATTAQFNISNFGEFITTYYTLGTGNVTSIPLNFGREIIAQMAKENALAFRFFLQARTSGIVTNAFSSTATLASLSGIRQEPEANDEEDELGTEGTTFVSALDRVNKTTTFNNTDCLNTVKLVLMKVEFTNAITGELYPCDLSNQANAKPPYVEIIDVYNRTVINRYCYLET